MQVKKGLVIKGLVVFVVAGVLAPPAQAASHLWRVNELFSNADGTVQFIELKECCGGPSENGTGGKTVTSLTVPHSIPLNNVAGNTANRHILLGTAAFAALPGAPPVDYTIVPNFFAINGDTIRYAPAQNYDSWIFGAGALPTNGVNSIQKTNLATPHEDTFIVVVNSPTNYAGQSGSVNAGGGCTDNDGDGYGNPGHPSCPNGGATDCNDGNPLVNPGQNEGAAAEFCSDLIDNDCDSNTDCVDSDCATVPPCADSCVSTPGTLCGGSCANAGETCYSKCVLINPFTGDVQATSCDCSAGECHVEVDGNATAGVPGNQCVVPDNGGGTVTLPPPNCGYLSPQDVHEIINGLPVTNPPTTIQVAIQHSKFFCRENCVGGQNNGHTCTTDADCPGGSCFNDVSACQFQVDCSQFGGGLGGEQECSNSLVSMQLTGTGNLSGFNRMINMQAEMETHIGPRTPGNPVQSFDTDMFRLQGQIVGDPDFDLLRITAGTAWGLPSPGHTTLTQLPGGQWSVDSFFDVNYVIQFQGAPGGPLAGMSGSTTGTIRMGTGSGASCVGTCPTDTVCTEQRTPDAQGNITLCCNCVGSGPQPPTSGGDDVCVGGPNNGQPCGNAAGCPSGACGMKSRYLSFTPPSTAVAGIPQAVKLTIIAMPQFPARVGEVWWATAPPTTINNSPLPSLTGSLVECTGAPDLFGWGGMGTIYLFGGPVAPSSSYEIRMCDAVGGPCSAPIVVDTNKWGDIVPLFGGGSQPNFGDVSAAVSKFQNLASAPATVRTDLVPHIPNHVTNFQDISAAVSAFQGFPYPNVVPPCP